MRRRRAVHHLAELSGGRRLVVVAVLVAVVATPLLGAVLVLGDGWQPVGDRAIIGLRSHDVWSSDRPDLGQPTTGENYTGEPSNHPGPSEYWLLAPFTAALGTRVGLAVGTAALSAAALATALLLAHRGGGRALFSFTALGIALLVRSLGASHFADPMNSELVAVFLLPTSLATWSVVRGDLRALPVLVATATVAAQAHVTGAANVAPLLVVTAGSVTWRLLDRSPGRERIRWRRVRGPVLLAGALLVVAWGPPIVHELGSGPSNVAALYRTATAGEPVVGYRYAADRLVTAVAPLPLFVLSDGAEAHRATRSVVGVLAAGAVLGALGSAAVLHAWRRRRSPVVALLATTGVVVVAGVANAARILRAQVGREDGFRSLWILGLLVWVGLCWAGWTALAPDLRRRWTEQLDRVLAVATAAVLLVALASTAGRDPARDGDLMPAAEDAEAQVVANVPDGRYRIAVEGTEALVTFAPGIVDRLEASGSRAYVDFGPFGRPYGSHRQYRGQAVDGTLVVRAVDPAERGPVGAASTGRPVATASAGGIDLTVLLEPA